VHDADLLLFEPLLELLEQVDRPGDARRGQPLDGAGRETALELAGAQQYLQPTAREGHAHSAVVLRSPARSAAVLAATIASVSCKASSERSVIESVARATS